jgi:hypothetical protein
MNIISYLNGECSCNPALIRKVLYHLHHELCLSPPKVVFKVYFCAFFSFVTESNSLAERIAVPQVTKVVVNRMRGQPSIRVMI